MRIIKMEPEEERTPRILLQPHERMVYAFFLRPAIDQARDRGGKRLGSEYTVIEIKAGELIPNFGLRRRRSQPLP